MGFSELVVVGNIQSFDNLKQRFIEAFDSAQSEATGWDAEVKAKLATSTVTRVSNTEARINISAQAGYNITAQEVITGIIPAILLTKCLPITATPTFTISIDSARVPRPPAYFF